MTREEAMLHLEIIKMGIRFNELYGEKTENIEMFVEAIDKALIDMQSMKNISNMVKIFPGRKEDDE